MTNTTSPGLHSRLQFALLNSRQKQKSVLQQGFTLVELMIVIVIVGILSAVAIPNFLAQTDKAKVAEAKTNLAAILKQAQVQYVEDGSAPSTSAADLITNYKAPAANTTLFNYTGAWATPVYTVTATGSSKDAGLTGDTIKGCVNFDTGFVAIQGKIGSTAPTCS